MTLPGSLWTPRGERLLRPVAGGAEWPTRGGAGVIDTSIPSGNNYGTTVISGAANTKGSWTQISAATPNDADWALVTVYSHSDIILEEGLLDLGYGAAPSAPFVNNLHISQGNYANAFYPIAFAQYLLPIQMTLGQELRARLQALTATRRVVVAVNFFSRGSLSSPGLALVETYGAVTADSGGTSVNPGATPNTKGAWVELTGGSGIPYDLYWLIVALGNQDNSVRNALDTWRVDIGVGDPGAQTVRLPDLVAAVGTGATGGAFFCGFATPPLPCLISAGLRIWARAQCNRANETLDVVAYGIA